MRILPRLAALSLLASGSASFAASSHTVLHYVGTDPIPDSIARPLVAYVDRDGKAKDWMFDGFIVFSHNLAAGRVSPTTIEDFRDGLFGDGHLKSLAAAVAWAREELGQPSHRLKVYLAAPYYDPSPDAGVTQFEIQEVLDHVQELIDLWKAWDPPELQLEGFYWGYHESVAPAYVSTLITSTADYVHSRNLQLIWIPYLGARGVDGWKDYHLDRATLQPGYAFRDAGTEQFLRNDDQIRRVGMSGPELELSEVSNPQIAGSDKVLANATAYLEAADTFNWSEASQITYYKGRNIAEYATSSQYRSIYDRIWRFVAAHPKHPAATDRKQIAASADTFVELAAGRTSERHGTDALLRFGSNPGGVRTYVRFDFDGSFRPGEVPAAAYLRLNQRGFPLGTALNDVNVGLVETDWSEGELCGDNAPALGPPIARHRFMPEGAYPFQHTVDVTEQVVAAMESGHTSISFSLSREQEEGGAEAEAYSRESGANGPALEVVYLAFPRPDQDAGAVDAAANGSDVGEADGEDAGAGEVADAGDAAEGIGRIPVSAGCSCSTSGMDWLGFAILVPLVPVVMRRNRRKDFGSGTA